MKKINELMKKMLNVPIHYTLTFLLGVIILITMIVYKQLSIASLLTVFVVYGLFFLHMKLGPIVIQSTISIFVVLYTTSLYTYFVSEIHQYIIQPFLLTIAGITCFLAMTYSSYNHGLRNRPLWAALLAIVTSSTKMGIILMDHSYLFAEIVGLNIIIIFMLSWHTWISNSKKTKIIYPDEMDEATQDKYKYIYINEIMDVANKKWIKNEEKEENAYPYVYTEVMKAREKRLTVVFVSTLKTSSLYDVGYVNFNRETIPYLYVEGRDDKYLNDILTQFELEVLQK